MTIQHREWPVSLACNQRHSRRHIQCTEIYENLSSDSSSATDRYAIIGAFLVDSLLVEVRARVLAPRCRLLAQGEILERVSAPVRFCHLRQGIQERPCVYNSNLSLNGSSEVSEWYTEVPMEA